MLDPLVQPLAIDEIGMSGEESLAPWVADLADEKSSAGAYLRLKAVEALGRLRAKNAIPLLRRIAETKRTWRWVHPKELRIVTLQTLNNLDAGWAQGFLSRSGIEGELNLSPLDADPYSSCIRQRRYVRVRMKHPVRCEATSQRGNARLEIRELNLGGGLATCEPNLPSGTLIGLTIDLGGGSARLQAFVRRTRAHVAEFEIAHISLEDRVKLRRFITAAGAVLQNPPLQARKRRSSPEQIKKR